MNAFKEIQNAIDEIIHQMMNYLKEIQNTNTAQ